MQKNALAKSSNRARRFRSGNAVLEAAFVLPVLLGLTFGAIEFGYFFYVKHTLQGAAREGARAGITPTATNTDITTAVASSMSAAGLQSSGYVVAIRNSTDTANADAATLTAGSGLLVKVTCTWGTVGSGFRPMALIGTTKQVVGQTVMRKEG